MTTWKRSKSQATNKISLVGFALALSGLFLFGNYLMIEGHRPYHEISYAGFVYPISGKGGYVFVSIRDLAALVGLIMVAFVS